MSRPTLRGLDLETSVSDLASQYLITGRHDQALAAVPDLFFTLQASA